MVPTARDIQGLAGSVRFTKRQKMEVPFGLSSVYGSGTLPRLCVPSWFVVGTVCKVDLLDHIFQVVFSLKNKPRKGVKAIIF